MLAVFFWSWIILCKLLSTTVPYFLWLKIKDALQMTKDRDNKKGFLILGTDKISQVYSSKNSTNRLLKADTHPDISPIWALKQLLYYDCGFYPSFRICDESQSSLGLGAQWQRELCPVLSARVNFSRSVMTYRNGRKQERRCWHLSFRSSIFFQVPPPVTPACFHWRGNIQLDDCYGAQIKFWVTCSIAEQVQWTSFIPSHLGEKKK